MEARTAAEIEKAFAAMSREKAGGLILAGGDVLVFQQARRFAELALEHRLPSIATNRGYSEAGGLMSYGPVTGDNFRRVAIFVDKIFKGAKPGDLPVEQPTNFDMTVNRKTATALGIKIPPSVLVRADTVIE